MAPAASLVVCLAALRLVPIQSQLTASLCQNKLKVQLKLAISRLRMTQQKDTAIAKQSRRAMAQLLEEKKLESARIRVENIIRSDITTELHEILELYCELLIARAQLLDTISPAAGKSGVLDGPLDSGLEEAVRSLIYAAPRTEIKELHQARALLIEKFGKDFAMSAMEGEGVAERVLKKLKVDTPPRELVDQYLRLIAETYNVRFPGDPDPMDQDDEDDDDDDDEGSGGQKVKALEAPLETGEVPPTTPKGDVAAGVASPIRIAPASPSTENVNNKLKLPDKSSAPKTRKASTDGAKKTAKKADGDGPGGSIPDLGDLAARFAALKKI